MNDIFPTAGGTAAAGPAPVTPSLRLDCACSSVLNFAMEQNGVPLVREVVVANTGADAVRDAVLEVTVEPGFSEPLRVNLAELNPGAVERDDRLASA